MQPIDKLRAKKKLYGIRLSLIAEERLKDLMEYNQYGQSEVIDKLLRNQKKNKLI